MPEHSLQVGILGDGQLAQMMCQEAKDLNINTYVLSTQPQSPASFATQNIYLADKADDTSILQFTEDLLKTSKNSKLTIESEFIDPDLLDKVQAETGIDIFPSPNNLRMIRDRQPQKNFLQAHNIPTSPTHTFTSSKDVKAFFDSNPDSGLVFKKRLFGYDGYGTLILKSKLDLDKISEGFIFSDWICEDFIPFQKELAVSFARNAKDQTCIFPWVETFQKDSKCFWVKGPLALSETMISLQHTIETALKKMNYVGFITFEVFETKDLKLLVNEIAPRVHNSAHYSLEGLDISQFKTHLMAGFNFDLPFSPTILSDFAMLNLISSRSSKNVIPPNTTADVHLHWYQKTEARPGRKMGHLTRLASTADQALLHLLEIYKDIQL